MTLNELGQNGRAEIIELVIWTCQSLKIITEYVIYLLYDN